MSSSGPDTADRPLPIDGRRLALLYELSCAFSARTDLGELITLVIARCREALQAEGGAVLLLDAQAGQLYFPYLDQEDSAVAQRLAGIRLPADQGIAGAVLGSRRALRIDDVAHDQRFYPAVDRGTGFTTRSMLAAPLVTRQGAIGVIEIVNRSGGGGFAEADLAFLEALGGSIAVAIENARLQEQLRESEHLLREQLGALRRDLGRRQHFAEIVGGSKALDDVFRLMESAAASPIAVLVEGETGTGKELVARAIHRVSPRAQGRFLAVNCAALPETLLESELFGHRRGAFTGATNDRRGLFEAAAGGTVFLDEVGEMPLAMQAKLLRVLEAGEVLPLGESRARRVDVRVISATNCTLESDVRERRFRDDLYFRLAAFPIRLPPLRARREDIPALVDHLLGAAAARHGKAIDGIEAAALDVLTRFDWPGNVRELQNELERAVALAPSGEPVRLACLSRKIVVSANAVLPDRAAASGGGEAIGPRGSALPGSPGGRRVAGDARYDLRAARGAFEAQHIAAALAVCGGNVSQAARRLGLSRAMLHRRLRGAERR